MLFSYPSTKTEAGTLRKLNSLPFETRKHHLINGLNMLRSLLADNAAKVSPTQLRAVARGEEDCEDAVVVRAARYLVEDAAVGTTATTVSPCAPPSPALRCVVSRTAA